MDACRFCKTALKNPVLSLGHSPLANSYLKKEQLSAPEVFYPLDVFVCSKCYLMQIDEHKASHDIFSDYSYFSSFSTTWLVHAKKYVDMIVKRCELDENSFVVEVASNDGYLLQYFKQYNVPTLGIEPAKNVAQYARKKGIRTDVAFFNESYVQKLKAKYGKADLIIGNNVLAHNPDLISFVTGLKKALKPEGVITLEFPHLLQLIKNNQFDTIYHEHYSYISLITMKKVCAMYGLKVMDVDELASHGGSLRVYIVHDRSKRKVSKTVSAVISKEKKIGLDSRKAYEAFTLRTMRTKRQLLTLLSRLKEKGASIVGYGAPAKGNTLLNFCGIREDFIDYTVDRSPHKQGLYLPGTHIPIYKPEKIRKTKPEYVLILPWNLEKEIMTQMSFIRDWGGQFIIPIPKPVIK